MTQINECENEGQLNFDEVGRWLSKNGDFSPFEEELRGLARRISSEQIIQLYDRFKSGDKLEFEWRDEFLSIFKIDESLLPPLEYAEGDIRISLAQNGGTPVTRKQWWKFW